MIAEKLRRAVLQAAISGKLTRQHPEDGTAAELLADIRAERARLVNEGKLKKQKPLPPVSEDEQPFEIPDTWQWVRLGEIATLMGGYAFKSQQFGTVGTRVVRISDFNEQGWVNKDVVRVADPTQNAEKYAVNLYDVLVCMTGTIGKILFVDTLSEKMLTNQRVATIRTNTPRSNKFTAFMLRSHVFRTMLLDKKTSTNGNISRETLVNMPSPVPPLAEQERIVAKLDEIMPLIDGLAELERERVDLDHTFAKAIEDAILQAAISGQLTDQRPEDGTAAELLADIEVERARLIEQRKLRKQKSLPPVAEEEQPFEIPETWQWTRLGDIFFMQAGKNIPTGRIKTTGLYPCFGGNGIRGYVNDFNRDGDYPIIGRQGALCGNVKFASGKFYATEHAVVVESIASTNIRWAALFLVGLNLNQYATATAQPGLAVKRLLIVPIPVPPIAEQERIVAKVDAVMSAIHVLRDLLSAG